MVGPHLRKEGIDRTMRIREVGIPPRVLVVDDNELIHDLFRRVLGSRGRDVQLGYQPGSALQGEEPDSVAAFEVDSAYHGLQALHCLEEAKHRGTSYALAFVDISMPPGWDGLTTIAHLWREDPQLEVVICSGSWDPSWDQRITELGRPDQLHTIMKPFDNLEVRRLAESLYLKRLGLRDRSESPACMAGRSS